MYCTGKASGWFFRHKMSDLLGKCFLVEVHPYMTYFCTFWQSVFSVTCFGAFLGGGVLLNVEPCRPLNNQTVDFVIFRWNVSKTLSNVRIWISWGMYRHLATQWCKPDVHMSNGSRDREI